MTKIVYNDCYGGFSLSHACVMAYAKRRGMTLYTAGYVRKADGRIDLSKLVPLTDEEAANAFIVHYYFRPGFSEDSYVSFRDIERHDPDLVAVVEDLGEAASGRCASLAVEDVPAGARYRIDEYDGLERVMTCDDYEWKTA